MKVTYSATLASGLLIWLLPGAAISQSCVENLDVWSPSGVDHIEVKIQGGWNCMSMFWITADGQLYGMDNRERGYQGRSIPRSVSASIPAGAFEQLLGLALAARNASREWYESNFPRLSDNGRQYYRERFRNADGACTRYTDGIDVSVNVSTDGVTYENECIGGQWAEFRRRFFALVDKALEPSTRQ